MNITKNQLIDLNDILTNIDAIVISVDDSYVSASDLGYDPDDDIEDIYYLSWSDDQLSQLSEDIVHKFTNIELLARLARICKHKLSAEQLIHLEDVLKAKYKVGPQQKDNIIKLLKECKTVYMTPRPKNLKFMNKYGFHDVNDIKKLVIDNLTRKDMDSRTRSISPDHYGNLIVIFKITHMELPSGATLDNKKVYLKIDVSDTTNTSVVAISFHE